MDVQTITLLAIDNEFEIELNAVTKVVTECLGMTKDTIFLIFKL